MKILAYQLYREGDISRSLAKRIIGDDWDIVAQVESMRRARKSNAEFGYSSDELNELFG